MALRQIPLRPVLLGTFIILGLALSQTHAVPSQLSPLQKELLMKIKRKMGSHVVDVLCTNPDGAEVSLKLENLKRNLPNIGVESANEYYFLAEEGTRYKCQKSAF